MKERPILFSGPMVRAILEGRKTMTRRVIKPQPDESESGLLWKGWTYAGQENMGETAHCPHGEPGGRLWVKETWRVGAWSKDRKIAVDYMADHYPREEWLKCEDEDLFDRLIQQSIDDAIEAGYAERDGIVAWKPGSSPCRKRPSIFMPRWASRITLEITGVRVERLQDISEEDAKAEGVEYNRNPSAVELPGSNTAKEAFKTLWESINGTGSWNANSWVWVIEFKRVEP